MGAAGLSSPGSDTLGSIGLYEEKMELMPVHHGSSRTTKKGTVAPLEVERHHDDGGMVAAVSGRYGGAPLPLEPTTAMPLLVAAGTTSLTGSEMEASAALSLASGDDDHRHHGHHGHHHNCHYHHASAAHSSLVSPKIGALPLAVMVFYAVSGGPIGIEPAVRAGGYLPALLGFLLAPLAWSLPEAFVTAELGSAFPEASGGVAWVEEAFGPTAGFVAGYFTWVAGATDNAIYPVLFLDYALQATSSMRNGAGEGTIVSPDENIDGVTRFVLLASTSIVLALINFTGLEIVGNMSVAICLISLSPFLILSVVGFPRIDVWRLLETKSGDEMGVLGYDDDSGLSNDGWLPLANYGGVIWRPFLNNLFWNLNSFDSAANFAGEVDNPGVVFPRAMFVSLLLVAVSYFVPLLVAIGASDGDRSDWTDGYLARVCTDVVGPWLGAWTVFAAGISNVALFLSEMSSDAFQIMGMAERGLIPHVFATKSRFGTPTYGVLLGTVVIVLMSVADFSSLVEMLNFNYSVALLMEYAAFIKLRISKGDVPRPYRIPLNTAGCILFVAPPVLMTLLIMALASYMTYIYLTTALVFGLLIYRAQACGRFIFCRYSQITDRNIKNSEGNIVMAAQEIP